MCGRYTLETAIDVLTEYFDLDEYPSSLTSSCNIAPHPGGRCSGGGGRGEEAGDVPLGG